MTWQKSLVQGYDIWRTSNSDKQRARLSCEISPSSKRLNIVWHKVRIQEDFGAKGLFYDTENKRKFKTPNFIGLFSFLFFFFLFSSFFFFSFLFPVSSAKRFFLTCLTYFLNFLINKTFLFQIYNDLKSNLERYDFKMGSYRWDGIQLCRIQRGINRTVTVGTPWCLQ